ncbi:hypothetical protein A4A49_06743 [Nicotiana attenuata]|uniref:Uncharacterized protein n=1 Tax=Nicotiana attenuata TaxID=49451 RepID=A0A1J6IGI1_NICAT|nr:hypothetical protein A4A49_06743 [Nicotiana attenuata]
MENEDDIPRSDMFLDELLSDDEHGESTGRFHDHHILNRFPFDPGANFLCVTITLSAANLCVWDLKLSSEFMPLTGSTEKEEAHTLFEEIRNKRRYLFAKLYDWEPVGGVETGVECSCNFQNSCTLYKLLGDSIAHSFLYSFDGAPTHLEEQSIITQLRNFRSGIICCHCEIAYLIVVMHWLLMELIHYEEDITRYSPVYKILMMLSCWVGVPNSKVLQLHQPSKVLALFADKKGWKSKAPAHFLKVDKGLHCLNLMDQSKLEHYSSSTSDLVVYLKFDSLPLDPDTLWGDWIYSKGKSTSCVVFTVAMCTDTGLVGQLVASQSFDLYPYDPGIQVLLPTSYGPVCRKEVVANVLLGDVGTYYSVKLVPRPKELSAAAANIIEAPEDAGWMTSDHRYINKRVQYSFNHFIPGVRWRDLFSMAIISVRKLKLCEMPYPMLPLRMGKGVVPIEIRLICVALSCAFLCTDARVVSHYVKLVADALLGTLRCDIRLLSLMADVDFRHYIITPRTKCEDVAVTCLFAINRVKRILLQFFASLEPCVQGSFLGGRYCCERNK